MSHTPQNIFKAWQNGQIVYAEDLVQEREILRAAANDNYARLIKQYRVLNADGSNKTTQNLDTVINTLRFKESDTITISLDNTTSTLTFEVVDGSVDTSALTDGSVTTIKVADLAITAQKIANGTITLDQINLTSLDSRYYTESEMDTKLSTKTDKSGNHEGTWQGLQPIDFDTGQQAADIQQLRTDLDTHTGDAGIHVTPTDKDRWDDHTNNKNNPHDTNSEQITKLATNAFSMTEPGTSYPDGVTMFEVSSTAGWPARGVVLNIKSYDLKFSQIFFENQLDGNRMMYRDYHSLGWSDFKTNITDAGGQINGNVDVNGTVSVRKSIPSIDLETTGRSGKTRFRWNASGSNEFGVHFDIDGESSVVIFRKDGRIEASSVIVDGVDLKNSVSNGKNGIASAITDMGGSASGSDTFAQLASAIQDISSTAQGRLTLSGTSILQVSGLSFRPRFIAVTFLVATDDEGIFTYDEFDGLRSFWNGRYTRTSGSSQTISFTITNDGFSVNHIVMTGKALRWFAVG